MNPFTAKIIDIIRAIPKGKVMTYGQIAAIAGKPQGGRQVSRILHTMSRKYDLPWHRVINVKGGLSLKGEGYTTQRQLLEDEGLCFDKYGRLDMTVYLYNPTDL